VSAQDPGPDYCFTCGGDHQTAEHEHGRVIKIHPKRGPEDLDATIPWDAPAPTPSGGLK
jgi:hypothetical protein